MTMIFNGDDEYIRSDKDLAEDYRAGMERQDQMIADYQRDNEVLRMERNGLLAMIQNIHENTADHEQLDWNQSKFKLRVVHDMTKL